MIHPGQAGTNPMSIIASCDFTPAVCWNGGRVDQVRMISFFDPFGKSEIKTKILPVLFAISNILLFHHSIFPFEINGNPHTVG
jgi:hypothetical protein